MSPPRAKELAIAEHRWHLQQYHDHRQDGDVRAVHLQCQRTDDDHPECEVRTHAPRRGVSADDLLDLDLAVLERIPRDR